MKKVKAILFICFFSLSHSAFSQEYGYFDVRSGFGDFVLGAPKLRFDSTLRSAGASMIWKGRTEHPYLYMPGRKNPYELAGVPFSDIILTFDQKDSLFRIELFKAKVKRLNVHYADSSRSEFQSLYKTIKASWDKKGKKKITTPYVGNTVTRYDWENKKVVMVLVLNEDKKQGISSIELSLEYKLTTYPELNLLAH